MIKANAVHMPLQDESVQSIITSPPYWGLRKYDIPDVVFADGWRGQLGNEPDLELYHSHLMLVMAECWRVLRDDGVCFVNLGDTYAGSGGAGSDGNGRNAKRKGLCYPKKGKSNAKPKSLCGIPEDFVIACRSAGWIRRNNIIWEKPNAMPSPAQDRFTVNYESVFFLTKQGKYCFDLDAVRVPYVGGSDVEYRKKLRAGKSYNTKEPYKNNTPYSGRKHDKNKDRESLWRNYKRDEEKGKNPGAVWHIPTKPYPEAHYATFPEKLVEELLLCSTKPCDRVLDPFGGSGTVGRVAIRLQRNPVLLDLGYHDQQLKRTNNVQLVMT